MARAAETIETEEPYGAAMRDRPIPRISIEAFCENPETGAALQRAAGDRRLSKAQVTVHLGGAQAAAAHFAETPTPNLIMIETMARGEAVLGELETLARVCDAGTKVVVIGQENDIALYRELIRAGVNEYLVAPLNPMQVIETIASIYASPDAPPVGRAFAVVGAKGGVGASTIAHNLAWVAAERLKIATTLVDLDLPFGTAGLDFNEDPIQGVADALSSPERLDDVLLDRLLMKHTERLSLLAAPASVERDFEAEPDALTTLLDVVRASSPCVFLDLPHLWAPWMREMLVAADSTVLVCAPDLASLRNAKNILDLLKTARPNDPAPHLVLNMVGVPKRPEIPVREFCEALELRPAMSLPFEPQLFGQAANNGQMIPDLAPKHALAQQMHELAEIVCGRRVAPEQPRTFSILDFLKGKAKA